jgi:hypothetical protein
VEVAAQRHALQGRQQLLDERCDLSRDRHPDRVGDCDLDRLGSRESASDLDDTRGGHFTLERAAERH